jgi:2-phosphosulfolactate phosphatase
MKINIIKSVNDAHLATWLAIVIDVFRAFSTQVYVFANGAEAIIPALTLEEAYQLKSEHPHYLLMWERWWLKPEWFDYGNSPSEIIWVDFTERTIIHTTSNGTKWMMQAVNADQIMTGSFINAAAIINYILKNKIKEISLISTSPEEESENEDVLLAYYIKDTLENRNINEEETIQKARSTPAHAFLLDEAWVPPRDIDLCLDYNRFNFVIKSIKQNDRITLIRQD